MPERARGDARRRVPRLKVAVPVVPRGFVSRPRLLCVLDRAQEVSTTLVCAPAGSGKTLLLADWVHRRGAGGTAWVALDSDDNDDRRFWSAVLDALTASPAVPRESTLRVQAVPPEPSRDSGFLAAVVNALDELPVAVRLVLDDVHELHDPEPLHGLETLLRHQPARLRLLLASRPDPPLPLAGTRLAGQLTEIGAGELKFSEPEAQELLEADGIELRPEQLRQLVEQTEGWAAGLRLAAVSLRGTDDAGRFLAEFAENDRAVADYLIDEVLSRLPDDLREFLCTISVGDEVSADLARVLSGRGDVGAMLDALERQASLLVRVGAKGRWYRMHALVRSYLLADLRRRQPARAAALHAKAADWFADHGQPVRALAQAGRAGNARHLAALLRREAVSLTLSGEHEVLRRALAVLGGRLIAGDSLLALVAASLHLEEGEPKAAALDLTHAEAAWPAWPTPDLETLRRLVRARQAQVTGDIDGIMRTADNLETESLEGPTLGALALLHRGTALLVVGRRAAAREQLRAALAAAREHDQTYVATQCLTMLGGLAATVGNLRVMTELAEEADTQAADRGWQQTLAGATAGVLLAYGALLRADLAECARQADRAGMLMPGNPNLHLSVGVLGGTARFELGSWAAGLRRIHEARLAAGEIRLTAEKVALTAVLEHRAAVRLGWGDVARDVLGWAQLSIPGSGEIRLMRARAQLVLGRHVSAARILEPLLDSSVPVVLPWSVIDAWLVEAEVAQLSGEQARALRALRKALSEARSTEVLYPLVSGAPEVVELLTAQRGKLGNLDPFAADVLAVRRELHAPSVPVPLTQRERSVLRLLPTLRSFEEIAEDLTVSPNTVKTHVRSIYGKLGVRRRRDAVTVAWERGLLEVPDLAVRD
jgi:LuxR family transcriptional regulator, maltose regulon positive regulatory protein